MKAVRALIFLSAISKSVPRVREFRRAPDHGNLLCYLGRPLTVEEFNKAAPQLLSDIGKTTYGMMPCAKMIEIDIELPAKQEEDPNLKPPAGNNTAATSGTGGAADAFRPSPVELPEDVEIEPIDGGFALADYRHGNVAFLGQGEGGWLPDVSLVQPFETEEAAKAAFTDANKPAGDTAPPVAASSSPTPEAAAAEAPAAEEPAPVSTPPLTSAQKNAAKRAAAKAAKAAAAAS